MCYGGLCSSDVDGMWDLFQPLAWYQGHYEIASKSFECPSPTSCDFHASSPLMCSYCQSSDHDTDLYPYYDISDVFDARLSAMIVTMHE